MAQRIKKEAPRPSDTRRKLETYEGIGDKLTLWRSAREVLVPVRGVRTRFLSLDSVTRIGSWPLDRVCTIHGPSNNGKTELSIGIGMSVIDAGGIYGHVDAEVATPITWVEALGGDAARSRHFHAMRPRTYEDTVRGVREFCTHVGEGRLKGRLPPNAPACIVIDSIRKLNPKKLLDELLKAKSADEEEAQKKRGRFGKAPKGVDGAGGRAAQMKAALNAQWMDELVPLAAQSGTAVILIAREFGDDVDDLFGKNITVGGGKAIIFDASLVCRVTRVKSIHMGEGKEAFLIGEKNQVEVRKTKIGGRSAVWPRAFFHTSNGMMKGGSPFGFDAARDAVELGKELGAITGTSHLNWGKTKLGQGENQAVKRLVADPMLLDALQGELRSRFVLDGIEAPEATL